jgi:phage-related minor tail protein
MSAVLKEKYLVKKYEKMSWREVANAPVSAISGVSERDAADLKSSFHIETVGDFAANEYVCIAQGINSFSKATAEILDKTFNSKEFEEMRKLPVNAIKGISEDDAALLKRAFGIDTIQELAENKYVCVAQTIVMLAFLEELVS